MPGAEQQVSRLRLSGGGRGADPHDPRRTAQTLLRRHAPLLRMAAGAPRRAVPRQRRRRTLGNGRKTDLGAAALARTDRHADRGGPLLRRHETGRPGADRSLPRSGGRGDRRSTDRGTHGRPYDPHRLPLRGDERHHARGQGRSGRASSNSGSTTSARCSSRSAKAAPNGSPSA